MICLDYNQRSQTFTHGYNIQQLKFQSNFRSITAQIKRIRIKIYAK